jgi:hypothetical protein
MLSSLILCCLWPLVYSLQITDVQGPAFRSPLEGANVQNLTGTVTAKVSMRLQV